MRETVLVLTALFYIFAGVMHFRKTAFYLFIMPPYLPHPLELVWISGVAEVLGGIGLLIPATRVAAGWGLIALLWAVFPANIHMAVNNVTPPGWTVAPWMLWVRLPVQFLLMWEVWWCAIRPM